jgi:hypothetical protein
LVEYFELELPVAQLVEQKFAFLIHAKLSAGFVELELFVEQNFAPAL